jgi:glycosyltransferase involved in cell wall biosynthesis
LPVEPHSIENAQSVRRSVRDELSTPPDAVVVLQASRLERWKGQSIYLEALAKLKDVRGWLAWMAGGPQRPEEEKYLAELRFLAAQAGIHDRVRFLGQRSDVTRLMAAADIYCQPNTGPEPFGIAFIEALYAGIPVLTFDLGGAREIVTEACGSRCQPGDVQALTATLRLWISDPTRRRALGACGPARARELCDPARRLADLCGALVVSDRVRI